jgi:hypothetical protein
VLQSKEKEFFVGSSVFSQNSTTKMTNEKKDSAVQESNAELRVRYLEFLQFLNKKPVNHLLSIDVIIHSTLF